MEINIFKALFSSDSNKHKYSITNRRFWISK